MAVSIAGAIDAAKTSGYLHLSGLSLLSVPDAVFALGDSLVRLDLSCNEISQLDERLGALTGLEELWLNDNPLRSLPTSLERCLRLRVVDLRNTSVISIPRELCVLRFLEHLDLGGCQGLPPQVASAYAKGGTLAVLAHLTALDTRRELCSSLLTRLTVDVYRESADTARGRDTLAWLVQEVDREFAGDNQAMRTVIRNAERLFPLQLSDAHAGIVRDRYTSLIRDHARKALAADVELLLRAVYAKAGGMEGSRVESMVQGIMGAIPKLEDLQFFVAHGVRLLPPHPSAVSGPACLQAVLELREKITAEKEEAMEAMVRALRALYPDMEPADVAKLAQGVASIIKVPTELRSLAADAAEYFPAEFRAARPKKVAEAFTQSKADI